MQHPQWKGWMMMRERMAEMRMRKMDDMPAMRKRDLQYLSIPIPIIVGLVYLGRVG